MKLKQIILFFLLGLFTVNNAFAFVNCQGKYDNDKRSLPSLRGSCGVCHINPSGGGAQNEFGRAFKASGFMITDELVAQFPNLFQKPKEEPTPPADNVASSSGSGQEVIKPIIKRVKPKKIKINIQSMASIIGKNFVEGSKTFIDNNEIITTFRSSVKLLIDFVLNSVGMHEVKVKNPDGQESNVVKIKAVEPKK